MINKDAALDNPHKKYIRNNTEAIKEKFRGLDSVTLLERYDNQKDPRFKNVYH